MSCVQNVLLSLAAAVIVYVLVYALFGVFNMLGFFGTVLVLFVLFMLLFRSSGGIAREL